MNHIHMPGTAGFSAGPPRINAGHSRLHRAASSGFSLIELLIAMTLSLVIMTGLLALFGNVSRTNSETAKSNELIENGRFAIQLLQNDLVHAGFWGDIEPLVATAAPGTVDDGPDPCLSYVASGTRDMWPTDPTLLAAYKINLMTIPVQGYADGSALTNCGITSVLPNSSVLIVRYANTTSTCVADGGGGCPNGDISAGPYLQLSGCRDELYSGGEAAYLFDAVANPNLTLTLRTKACKEQTQAGTTPANQTRAPARKMVVNAYYVALSDAVPNLMRASMLNGVFSTQPLVEGIEAFQVEYGIDNVGANSQAVSTTDPINPGDGNADSYVTCPAAGCNLATLANVVAVKLYVLSRNLETTAGYTNTTAYQLGSLAIPAFNDHYKRHVFSTTVRLVNIASRREIP